MNVIVINGPIGIGKTTVGMYIADSNPGIIYYVRYNDEMDPISDTYWLEGISYSTYRDALEAQQSL